MPTANRKLRLGFIGAGWWATTNHMPVLQKRADVEFTAVCRLGADELQQVKERFGFQHATQDYKKLLELDLDAVIVTSPHTLHFEHALAALKRGLPVMVEKPLTTNAAQARQLVDEARRQGVPLLVPYGWHYKPFVQEAKRRMDSGAIGNIEFLLCHMASPIRALLEGKRFLATGGGAGENMFEPAADTWADPKRAGGGYALAQMSHSAGLAFFLTGLVPAEVTAYTHAPTSRVELYDAFSVRFASGAIGNFSGAGSMPSDKGFQVDIRIFGDEGVLNLDLERARMEVQRHDGKHYKMRLKPGDGAYDCIGPPNNFADLILGRAKVNWAPGEAGMRAIELIDAAYRSALSGRPEKV